MFSGPEVTLEQMLAARERRVETRDRLLTQFCLPLIVLTVNIPGPRKDTRAALRVFDAGRLALFRALETHGLVLRHQELGRENTGHEAYLVVDAEASLLKKVVMEIEEGHPLGRIMDIDVTAPDRHTLSRSEMGDRPRRCLLCGGQAHACARSRAHGLDELLQKIDDMVYRYDLEENRDAG